MDRIRGAKSDFILDIDRDRILIEIVFGKTTPVYESGLRLKLFFEVAIRTLPCFDSKAI